MELTTDQQFAIDFNAHEVSVQAGLRIPPLAEALILGIPDDEIAAYQAEVDAQNVTTAREIEALPETEAFLARFTLGQRVLFLGDSITTYRYSYARVLPYLLEARGVSVINRAYSGYTSLHGVELTYTQCIDTEPDHVFVKYGTNDSKRFGAPDAPLFVSIDEYANNLRMIVRGFQQHAKARITLLTPTQLVEPIVAADANIVALRIHWFNRDLRACGDVVAQIAQEMGVEWVDLRGCLGDPPDAALFCPDGLHPNAEGEKRMLMAIVRGVRT